MFRFEVITSSFDSGMDALWSKSRNTAKKALNRADTRIHELAYIRAPVHVEGYPFQGHIYPGGTLQNSFTAHQTIGVYEMYSEYRMSGERNPVAQGVDYAFYQEAIYSGPHKKGQSPYLEPSVMEVFEDTLTFIANDLYLN